MTIHVTCMYEVAWQEELRLSSYLVAKDLCLLFQTRGENLYDRQRH